MFLVFTLAACGKSKAATNADNLIMAIGEVTLKSEEAIIAAEEAVANLEEKDQKQLEFMQTLDDSRIAYNNLLVERVELAIDNIGEVTLESEQTIKDTRELYEEQSENIKESVKNCDVLQNAEKHLSELKVSEVERLISEIGEVTLNAEDRYITANTSFQKLSKDEKAAVSNSDMLDNAEETLSQLKAERKEAEAAKKEKEKKTAISKLKSKTDKVSGITWYEHPNQPHYVNSRSYVLPYIGVTEYSTWLRLRFLYTGDDWIFWDNLTILVDGNRFYKTYSYYDVERDNDHGDVWEYIDYSPTNEDIEMLKAIANSNETIVRFQGDSDYYDLKIKSSDKTAIKDVLSAYEYLK